MNKVLSKIKKPLQAIFWMALIFVLIFLLIAGIIQIPAVQNKIVRTATTFISTKTHTKVEIKNVSISFPKSVVLEGLYLEDLKNDTLIYAGKTEINIALTDLLFNRIVVNSFSLENMNLHLYSTETDSLFNYNFLLTAFSDSTTNTETPVPKQKSAWTFSVGNVDLQNIRIRYDDEFKGMNVSASLDKLNLQMDKIDLENSIYNIDDLLVEKLKANVLIKKTSDTPTQKSESILPQITANNLQINNSIITYGDLITKQTILAALKRFELKEGVVDLQKELVTLDKIYLSESDIRYLTTDMETSSDTLAADTITPSENNWTVAVKRISLYDNSLTYRVGNKPAIRNAFDSDHLKYSHLKLEAENLDYSADKTEISVKKFSAIDQNNFAITQFETNFSMDNHSITLQKLKAKTTNSAITGDVNLQFASLKTLQNTLGFLVLNIDIQDASFQNSDILYFSPELSKQEFFRNKANITTLSGVVNGRVNNMRGKNLRITTGANTVLTTDFYITGLPVAETASFNFPDLKLVSGKQDIQMMAGSSIPKSIEIPNDISLDVVFKGKIKEFAATVGLNSTFGNASLLATIDKAENFSANLSVMDMDLGSLMKDKSMYGPVSLTAEAKGKGLDPNTIKAKIKGEVTSIYLNKYTYHNLTMDGDIAGREFVGKVNLRDKNAEFEFDGLVNMNPHQEQYKFNFNVMGADLQKLNFTKNDMRISFLATTDLKGGSVNKMNGNAGITNLIIAHNGKRYGLDSLLVASINEPNRSEFNVNSAIMDVKYSGTMTPTSLPAALTHMMTYYLPVPEAKPSKAKKDSSNFKFEIQLHNHPILSEVLMPQLKEFDPGVIVGSFDSKKKELKLNAKMKKIVYGSTQINNLEFDVKSDSTALNYIMSSTNISNPQIRFENFLFEGKVADNKILANISSIDENKNRKLFLRSEITKANDNYKLELDPTKFYLMNNRWDIARDNYIEFGKKGFLIHNFFINNAASQINIASVHNKFNDDVNISFKNFNLGDISRIIQKDSTLVKGELNGNVLLKRVNNTYGIIADADIRDLIVREVPIGNLALKADNPTSQRFDLDVNLSGTDNNVTAKGYYIPNGGDNSINIQTSIQSLSMKTIEAFSMGQITEASGTVTGTFLIGGKADVPEVTGEMVFNNAFMKPAALNNRLELKHETIQLKPDGIYFNSFTMLDPHQHSAIIDGSVQMKQFSDFIFGLHVTTKDFLLFNTEAKDNKEFYGKMVIDSKIDVTGPMALPVINAKVKMKEGSNFTFVVPEDKLNTDKGEEVVQFNDSLKLNPILTRGDAEGNQKSNLTGFDLSSVIEVDKKATLRLLMDPTSSDSLVVRGEAALSLTMDRSGKMSLTGAYNLDDGSYLVSLQSVIKRKFDINAGSTLIWNGDPMDADISLNATYSLRTAPYDLMADQLESSDLDKGGYKQQYPFLVVLKLRGAILKPEISFEIQLAPEDKGILNGAVNQKLNMLNEDPSSLNKQVFALLVLGRFVQENPLQSEAGGGTSAMVRSTVGSFLSSQLNKLSSKVVPGVDLSFDVQSYDDYETGQAQGRTQVEIGLKKQLFNERLSVELGGTLDVEGDKAKQNSASDITSDVTVEYKLTEDGRYRLKGFRHNQYEGALEGQLIETGAGVVYVRDFNKWKHIFKKPEKQQTTSTDSTGTDAP